MGRIHDVAQRDSGADLVSRVATERADMIKLTRLNETEVVVNAEMIEFVEAIPDTIISLASGKKLMVTEPVEVVVERVIEYRRSCSQALVSGIG